MKLRIPSAYLLFLLLLSIFFWSEMVFLNKLPFFRDVLLQFYPWQVFADNSVSSGVVPLWNNLSGCGAPFLANLQSAVFYPLKLVFYVLPFAPAVKVFIVLHFILAAVFMFYLARDFKIRDGAAFFAALVFAFNGYLVSRVEFFSVLASSIWLPLIVLFLKKLIETGKFKYFAYSSLVLALPVFAGSIQIFFYNIIIALAFTVWYSRYSGKSWIKGTVLFVGATVVSLLVSSIQLFPFVEYVLNSVRQTGMNYDAAATGSLLPSKIINFFTPFIWGNPSVSAYFGKDQLWLSSFYCSIPAILLTVLNFTAQNRASKKDVRYKKTILFFSIVLLFFVIISLGRYGLLHWLLYQLVPLFRLIRYPPAAMYGAVFCLALLSGLVLEKLPLLALEKKSFRKIIYTFSVIIISLAGVFVYLNYLKSGIDQAHLKAANYSILAGSAVTLAMGLLLYYYFKKRILFNTLLLALSLLVFFDLFINSNGLIPLKEAGKVLAEPKIAAYLKADTSDFRISAAPNAILSFRAAYQNEERYLNGYPYASYLKDVKRILHNNYGMMCGLESAEIYDPMRISRQEKYFTRLGEQKTARETPLLDLANIKYLLSSGEIREEGFLKRGEEGGLNLYENTKVLPRAFVVYNTENTDDSNETFLKISSGKYSLSETAVVEGANTLFVNSKGQKSTSAGALYLSGNRVLVDFHAAAQGLLVLLDSYYPGWEAKIDGVECKILKTNYLFRGVLVPAGMHTVEFCYRPVSFRAGVAVSITAFALLLLASLWLWVKNIYR